MAQLPLMPIIGGSLGTRRKILTENIWEPSTGRIGTQAPDPVLAHRFKNDEKSH
jgi:hypothetical protein